jgi:hypothetical protein
MAIMSKLSAIINLALNLSTVFCLALTALHMYSDSAGVQVLLILFGIHCSCESNLRAEFK